MNPLRVPFVEAINEERLLKPRFGQLGLNQRAILKTIYGVPLDAKVTDKFGFTEVDYWNAGQGFAEYDEFGFITKLTGTVPYPAKEFGEAWIVAGRRAGKSEIASFIVAYEASLGGHEKYKREGKPAICYLIAQDTRMAKFTLHSINANLESMEFIFNKGDAKKNRILQVTADRIDLWNKLSIHVMPPTVKSVRGYDNPIAVLDEVGVWYQDSDSANPDFEVYRAVSPGQAQFVDRKIIGISSPWNKAGMLYDFYEAGTQGSKLSCERCKKEGPRDTCRGCDRLREVHENRIVIHTTTAASTNKLITKSWLREERNKDPRAFERECLARFQDSISGFLNASFIERARSTGVFEREAQQNFHYVAAIDPAFRHDAFAFTVVHTDPEVGVVQDYVKRWINDSGIPIDPREVFSSIAQTLHAYGLKTVFSDQYSNDALQFIAQQFGFSIQEVAFTGESKAEIYGSLQSLLNQNRISLLDDQDTLNELKTIEKKLTQGGGVQIGAPQGQHDDLATVVALAAHEAIWMAPKRGKKEEEPKTIIQRHIEHVAAQRRQIQIAAKNQEWDW